MTILSIARSILVSTSFSISLTLAQTVTVTTSADVVDINWSSATLQDLPGPDGKVSFSEAMIVCNNTPGHQTVGFAIPRNEWILQFLLPGRAVLQTTTGFFFRASDSVTVDGTTQTAFTGDTNPEGWEVAIYGGELFLNADNCTMIGFDSTAVSVTGSNGLVQGNTGSMNISLFRGSGSRVVGNHGGTIKIDRSDSNVVIGNTVNRVRVQGFSATQTVRDNRIGGPTLAERNYITGYGGWNSEGLPSGTTVELFCTTNCIVENNWIGTTPDGLAQGSNASNIGIGFYTFNEGTIVRGNRIAGILGQGRGPHWPGTLWGYGIWGSGQGQGITIQGNTIGLDANGAPTLGSVYGVDLASANTSSFRDVQIGGPNPGEGNVIAGHRLDGIVIGRNAQEVRLSRNSIHSNQRLGIDLIPTGFGTGVTTNDPGDIDTGGNGLQNFPVLTSATHIGSGLRIVGSLNSSAFGDYRLEFFAISTCDPNGHGEGEVFLDSFAVRTDASGNAIFDVTLPRTPPAGWQVTSTATLEPVGSTSEFSACIPVTGVTCQADLGFAGPGTARLSFCGGDLSAGTRADLRLLGATPNQPALLVLADSLAPTPLFAGTLVPVPPRLIGSFVTDPAGSITLPGLLGGGGPSSLYAQFLWLDPNLTQGFGFSNAVRADFLP